MTRSHDPVTWSHDKLRGRSFLGKLRRFLRKHQRVLPINSTTCVQMLPRAQFAELDQTITLLQEEKRLVFNANGSGHLLCAKFYFDGWKL